LTVLIGDALLSCMRRVGVRVLVVVLGAGALLAAAGCRPEESRVCDAQRADLVRALATLDATSAKPDDVQKHRDLRDQLGALSKRIEANRIPRLDTEDPSELTMRALEKLVMSETNVIEALDPTSQHPLSAAQFAETNNVDARAELLKAIGALRSVCER
jgi:hypothetical protein